MEAVEKNITIARKQYKTIDFQVTDENLEGLGIRWVLSRAELDPPALLLKQESDMTVSGDTATVALATTETDYAGQFYYEFWVQWQPDQWVKQFKGKVTFNKSSNYTTG